MPANGNDAWSAAQALSISPEPGLASPTRRASPSATSSPDPPPPWARRSPSSRRLSTTRFARHQPPALTRALRAAHKTANNLWVLYLRLPPVQRLALTLALVVVNVFSSSSSSTRNAIFRVARAPCRNRWARPCPGGWVAPPGFFHLLRRPFRPSSATHVRDRRRLRLRLPARLPHRRDGHRRRQPDGLLHVAHRLQRLRPPPRRRRPALRRPRPRPPQRRPRHADGRPLLPAALQRVQRLPRHRARRAARRPFAAATALASPKLLVHVFIGSRLALIADKGDAMTAADKAVNYTSMALGGLVGLAVGCLIYHRTMARAAELALEQHDHAHPDHEHRRRGSDGSSFSARGVARGMPTLTTPTSRPGLVDPEDVAALMNEDDISLWGNEEDARYRDEDEAGGQETGVVDDARRSKTGRRE
ncbi:conserved hypothetical protein [Verticillium alfalfae VaMs.102]|uniref:Uncharacterized protein n=1 Tax=Verticillium alfalfae (strain VaMs.102 / ATCC MYA-4576 / FGSC 10136) TaxID=526221 RepID=C9SI61_VERA1|nr:conserved hypothetical protein [Verticillium alfalfae VaMs.102]EEY18634.1 conserved hypothetical protein [Verticillium alfalfae VaMs.102]